MLQESRDKSLLTTKFGPPSREANENPDDQETGTHAGTHSFSETSNEHAGIH